MTNDPQEDKSQSREGPTDMATLLAESEDFRSPERGEVVEGTVMDWDRDGLIVDIGSKTEGIVPRHELHSLGPRPDGILEQGEKVLLDLVQPAQHQGRVAPPLDGARGARGWRGAPAR